MAGQAASASASLLSSSVVSEGGGLMLASERPPAPSFLAVRVFGAEFALHPSAVMTSAAPPAAGVSQAQSSATAAASLRLGRVRAQLSLDKHDFATRPVPLKVEPPRTAAAGDSGAAAADAGGAAASPSTRADAAGSTRVLASFDEYECCGFRLPDM